jgi:bisphosphoglycerate-independent phosphoglycerate mutase (AlkP superfamily)
MVGHTGNFEAAVTALQCLDPQLARLIPVILDAQGTLMITADHGNADEMYELDKKGKWGIRINAATLVCMDGEYNIAGPTAGGQRLSQELR